MYNDPRALLRQIQLGEDSSLELKQVVIRGKRWSAPKRDDLADEIAAMANTTGGVLVLGVDDKTKDILGIEPDHLGVTMQTIEAVCQDSIKPPVRYLAHWVELPDSAGTSRAVLKVDVSRSLFVHRSPGGYFYRQGSTRVQLSPEQLARLFQQRSQARLIRFDEQAVPETDASTLSQSLYERFIGDAAHQSAQSTLHKMGLLTLDAQDRECASVGGVLMACKHPEQWLPGAIIEAVHYRGTQPDANYQLDAQTIVGPLDQQVAGALAFVRRNMRVAATKALGRLDAPQFSLRAVLEAVVNAVAHRDYSVHGSKIRLFIFNDRLELYSPGALPNSVTVDSLALRQVTRNELVTSLLAKCNLPESMQGLERAHLIEKRGEGVPIILDEGKRIAERCPEYQLIDNAELLLTLWGAPPPERETTS